LLLALAAGILVTVRQLYDNGTFVTTSLSMPLSVVIALLMLFIGLSAVGRIGLLRGVVLGVSIISGAEALRVAAGGQIHPEVAALGINPITIGQYAALGILLSIFLIKLRVARTLHVLTLLVCAAGLAATDSRGPMVALGLAFLTMYVQHVLNKDKKPRDFRVRPLGPLLAIIAAVLAINAAAGQFYLWFRASDGDGNVAGRLDAYSAAARSILASPFLGWGADRYNMGALGAASGLPTFPHNLFLEIWSEYGLIAFVLFVAALVLVVTRSGAAGRPLALGFILCFCVSGSLDTSLGLWVALALALMLGPTSEQVAQRRRSQDTSGPGAEHPAAATVGPPLQHAHGWRSS
jgi:O-antigen ligase